MRYKVSVYSASTQDGAIMQESDKIRKREWRSGNVNNIDMFENRGLADLEDIKDDIDYKNQKKHKKFKHLLRRMRRGEED